MIRAILAGTVTAAALTMAPAVARTGPHHTQRMAIPRWMTRPCAEEDSVNCYWNARTMGNGRGHSFYVRRMPGDITGLTCWTYVGTRYAANHDHCAPVSR